MSKLFYRALFTLIFFSNVSSILAEEETPFKVIKKEVTEKLGYSNVMIGNRQVFRPNYCKSIHIFYTSLSDSIKIKDVKVNRGNCNVSFPQSFPVDLKFGETLEFSVDCNPIEIRTDTDQGSWVNTWKQ